MFINQQFVSVNFFVSVLHSAQLCTVHSAVTMALVAYLALETAVTGGGSGGSGSLGTDLGHGGNRRQAGWLLGCNYRFRMLNTAFQSLNISALCFKSET